MQIFLCVGNHGKRDGIEDFIKIISDVLSTRGCQIIVANELKENAINIVIDEFTNYIFNKKIVSIKQNYPNTKIIFVLTEFIESWFGVKTFNYFGSLFGASILSLINLYLRIRREDFLSPTIKDYLIALVLMPVSIPYLLIYEMKRRLLNNLPPLSGFLHAKIYMHMRYLGFESTINHADLVLLAHEKIRSGLDKLMLDKNYEKIVGVIYPEIDLAMLESNLFKDKVLGMEITGSVTVYRQKWIEKVNRSIQVLGIAKLFASCQRIPFSVADKKGVKRGAYSLHPPQSRKWKFCSPTRIYRALTHDHNMPVLTKNFGQNPIEDLCLIYDGDKSILQMFDYYHNKPLALDFLSPRVAKYNEVAKMENTKIVTAINQIADQSK